MHLKLEFETNLKKKIFQERSFCINIQCTLYNYIKLPCKNNLHFIFSDADEDEIELKAVELLDENEEQLEDDQKDEEEEEESKEEEEEKEKENKEESTPKKEGEGEKKEEKTDPDAPEKTLLTHGIF